MECVAEAMIALLVLALVRLGSSLDVMTLEECERLGLQFCFTGFSHNREQINAAIESSSALKETFAYDLRPSRAEVEEEMEAVSNPRFKRDSRLRVRQYEEKTVCDGVCCSKVWTTQPFSFLRNKDGWAEVASTPEYPQRTVFRAESCNQEKERCKNVESKAPGKVAICVTVQRSHFIYYYNSTVGGSPHINRREIKLDSGCRCKVVSPFE